jgi:hypothetical protein
MSWFKVDDHLCSHPLVFKVGDEALGYWMRLGCWLAQFPDSGDFIPNEIADMMLLSTGRRKRTKITRLVEAGMLEPIDGGYRMYTGLDICGSRLSGSSWDLDIHTGRRPRISQWLKAAVIDRDGLVCQLCFGPVELNDIHLDHIRPFSHGGPTSLANLQVTHSRCNMSKGARV